MSAFQAVKTEQCKSCGSTVKQFNPNSEIIICDHCGTNTADENPTKIETQLASRVPKNPLLKLHETFEYQSKTWQIIGCICYTGEVREWDGEDGVWETNYWKYNSWWVMNEAREIAWITHDSTGYKWSRKTVFKGKIPETSRTYEKGSWKIASAAGEFSYFPKVGGSSTTYERGESSIEILLDSQGNKKEIEAFVNKKIKPLDLLKAFNKTDLLESLKRSKLAQKAIFSSIVCLLLGYFLLTLRSETLLKISPQTFQHPFKAKTIQLGQISLDKKSLLQFRLYGTLPGGNGSFEADLIIRDDKNVIVSEVPISLWRASGRDSDGSWTETKRSVDPFLNLPANKQYRLTLKPTILSKWKKVSISGLIEKNKTSSKPLFVGIVLLGLLLLFQFVTKRNFIRKHTGLKV